MSFPLLGSQVAASAPDITLRSRQELGEVDTAPPEDICPQLSWA